MEKARTHRSAAKWSAIKRHTWALPDRRRSTDHGPMFSTGDGRTVHVHNAVLKTRATRARMTKVEDQHAVGSCRCSFKGPRSNLLYRLTTATGIVLHNHFRLIQRKIRSSVATIVLCLLHTCDIISAWIDPSHSESLTLKRKRRPPVRFWVSPCFVRSPNSLCCWTFNTSWLCKHRCN